MPSVVLHGGEVWADALDKEVHRKRVASAYLTDSEPAVMVITEVIPGALLAKERKAIYSRKGEDLRELIARNQRQHSLNKW